jgi:hypothetical protein
VQAHQGPIDPLVPVEVKMIGVERVGDVVEDVVIEKDAAQEPHLGFAVLRGNARDAVLSRLRQSASHP